MDRRQQKTRKAIFRAFCSLLERKRYEHITVQDIIDEADVGRSTFYAHFETKDLLLDAMCSEIFTHVFENDPCPGGSGENDLESRLAHTLWHIRDRRNDLAGLLLSDSSEVFMGYFKGHLRALFEKHEAEFRTDVPRDFLMNHLVGSFAEAAKWWLQDGRDCSPEEAAGYFMRLLGK